VHSVIGQIILGIQVAYIYALLKLVPKNLLSFLTGFIVRIRFPLPISRWLLETFVRHFKINMAEAERSIDEYATIEDVFTRKLKPDCRPLAGPVVSPSDGFLAHSGPCRGDRALQVKGNFYSLEELVFGPKGPEGRLFDPGWSTTVYLAPHNYHRVHSPISGILRRVRYIPGELWPVNTAFVNIVPNLFSRNERVVFEIEADDHSQVEVVMVGALNVGRIVTPFVPGLASNELHRLVDNGTKVFPLGREVAIAVGDELGTFLLGSTVVIVFDKQFVERHPLLAAATPNLPIQLGESLLEPKSSN
jgi:phosphatidylserine decarboxylase